MGKRSDFPRIAKDAYQTIDSRAVLRLLPHIRGVETFAEPCAGDGLLIRDLERCGLYCTYRGDIVTGQDALETDDYGNPDAIISNPPWSRPILHAMILHFQKIAPTWLLFDADWKETKQAAPFLPQCSHVVAVGRLIWIPGTNMSGKDNVSWYRFDARHSEGPRFIGQMREAA